MSQCADRSPNASREDTVRVGGTPHIGAPPEQSPGASCLTRNQTTTPAVNQSLHRLVLGSRHIARSWLFGKTASSAGSTYRKQCKRLAAPGPDAVGMPLQRTRPLP